MTDLTSLRLFAQEQADKWGDDVLLIEHPPPSSIHNFTHRIAYVVLASVADEREVRATTEVFKPRRVPCTAQPHSKGSSA